MAKRKITGFNIKKLMHYKVLINKCIIFAKYIIKRIKKQSY